MRKKHAMLAAGVVIGLWAGQASGAPREEPIQPIAAAVVKDPAKVELGKKLFFDPRLSRSPVIPATTWAWAVPTT